MTKAYLKNNSKEKSLSIRFGDGMRDMLQIMPGQIKPIPSNLREGLLKTYLFLFKGDLVLVDNPNQEIKDENEGDKNGQSGPAPGGEDEGEAGRGDMVGSEDENKEGDQKGESSDTPNPDQGSEEGLDDENPSTYTKKELNNMSAEQVREIATKLGIDITNEATNTKKELIPEILKIQEGQN